MSCDITLVREGGFEHRRPPSRPVSASLTKAALTSGFTPLPILPIPSCPARYYRVR